MTVPAVEKDGDGCGKEKRKGNSGRNATRERKGKEGKGRLLKQKRKDKVEGMVVEAAEEKAADGCSGNKRKEEGRTG